MDESLTERRRVVDEVLRDVNTFMKEEFYRRYFMNKGLPTLCQQER